MYCKSVNTICLHYFSVTNKSSPTCSLLHLFVSNRKMTVGETFLFLHNVIQLGRDWIIAGSDSMRFLHGRRTAAAKGLKDKRSIQTHPSAKTSWVWTAASCEEWGNIDSPGASLWGQLAHPTASLQSKHRHTLGLGYILKKKKEKKKIRFDNLFFF